MKMLKANRFHSIKRALLLVLVAISNFAISNVAISNVAILSKKSAESFADKLLYNGNIITLDAGHPKASALAIANGEILDLGSSQEMEKWLSDDTEIINLAGLTVVPGFIDSHVHVFEGASEVGGECDMDPQLTLAEHGAILKSCSQIAKSTGEWLTGYGFQLDVFMDGADPGEPLTTLDRLFPGFPVAFMEESSHAVIVNSMALQILGFDEDSAVTQGGRLARHHESGTFNGILFENAGDIAMETAWNSQSNLLELSYQGLLAGLEELAAHGITTAGDGYLHWRKGWFEVWQKAQRKGELTARVSLRPYYYPHIDRQKQLNFFEKIASNDHGQRLIVNQAKIYMDGVLHFGTAKVKKPYKWSWQENDPTGFYYLQPKAMKSLLMELNKIGYGAHIHAIGDEGISQAINAVEYVRKKGSYRDSYFDSYLNYGLTHLEMLQASDIPRLKRHNITADYQAGAAFFASHDWAVPYIGNARSKRLLQMRKVFNSGANVTFSSDWTVNDLNPLVAIANSLRHKNGQGLPNIKEALKAATINGAKALGLDKITGSLKPGKSADLVLLTEDITRLSPAQLEQVEVLMTILEGEIVFEM